MEAVHRPVFTTTGVLLLLVAILAPWAAICGLYLVAFVLYEQRLQDQVEAYQVSSGPPRATDLRDQWDWQVVSSYDD
jgi:hypothetical protein